MPYKPHQLIVQTAFCAALFAHPVNADTIRTETYSPDRVYTVNAKVGRVALVQLEAGETLNRTESAALGLGDSEAWTLGVKGNNILFKPKAEMPDTNMIIVSDKGRTYVLNLVSRSKAPTSYVLRFRYPDTEAANIRAANSRRAQAFAALNQIPKLPEKNANTDYWARGDKNLVPTAAWDNGRFTYFQFDNGRELPSFYKVMPDGSESLLNTHMESNTVVVHETAAKFVLRLGRSVLGIDNRGYDGTGQFNRTGTDDNQSVRLLKQATQE